MHEDSGVRTSRPAERRRAAARGDPTHAANAGLRERLRRRWQRARADSDAWLARHPVVATLADRTGCVHPNRRTLARGVAVGTFIGLSPTVGFQTLLMLAGCMVVRGNFPAAFVVSWVSNPITMAPLYIGFNRLGEAVFGEVIGPEIALGTVGGHAAEAAVAELAYLLLGSLLIAGPAAAGAYLLFLGTSRALVVARRRTPLHLRRPRRRHGDPR